MVANPGRHSLSTQNAKSSLLDGRPLVKRPRIFEAAGQVIPRMRHPQSLTTCRAKPGRAKRGSAVTRPSEARCLGRAKRGVTPSLARAAKQARMRFNCRDSTAASKRPWSAGKRALHERDFCDVRFRSTKTSHSSVPKKEYKRLARRRQWFQRSKASKYYKNSGFSDAHG